MLYKARESTPDIEATLGKKLTFFAAHQHLTKIGLLNSDQQTVIQKAQHIRNNIVHHTDFAFSQSDILEAKDNVNRLYNWLSQIYFERRGPDEDSSQAQDDPNR